MTNLKKVLSLALVFAMALGLMMSAGAVEVSDWDDIENQAAVQLLSSLNIMSGHADGTFNPDGVLTRAQVAKMIYVARTGGVDDQAVLYKGASNTFTDTKGHWAEGYINYAFTKGFVTGRGAGLYVPNASITGFELLKIALTALGYDATAEGFVGSNWKANVAALAQEAGLTNGYDGDPNLPITRDEAAGVFATLIYATTVKYDDGFVVEALDGSNDPITFGERFLNLVEYKGVLTANEYAGLDTSEASDNVSTIATAAGAKDIPAETSIDLLGYHVTALVREKNNQITKVFSVLKTVGKNNDVVVTPGSNLADTTVTQYVNYDEGSAAAAPTKKYIDNTGNGKYDIVLGFTYTYGEVTLVTTNNTTKVVTATVGGTGLTSTAYNGVADLAKGDRVLYFNDTDTMAKGYVVKIAPVAGKLTKLNSSNLYVDGVKYSYSAITGLNMAAVADSIGAEGDFYIYNNAVLEFDPVEAPLVEAKYAYVYDIGESTDGFDKTYMVKVVLDDGTKAVYTVSAQSAVEPDDVVNGLYTYSVDANEKIKLTAVGTTGQDTAAYNKGSNKLGTKFINASTIVFVSDSNGVWSVFKGIGNIPSINANTDDDATIVLGDLVGTNDLVKVVAIPGSGTTVDPDTTTKYLIMSEPALVGKNVLNQTLYTFTAFNGTEVAEYTYVGDASAINAKEMYTFTPDKDGNLTDAESYTANATVEATGVFTYCANNIIGYRAFVEGDSEADPVVPDAYGAVATLEYTKDTKFYVVNYAAGTAQAITADQVATHAAAEFLGGNLPTADIDYVVNGDGVVTAVYYIAG